ncbi:MAG: Rieske (2Fe-2S) protein [Rhodospirillaceae bacterium]|nr:Rieske (2Fe-2S) protein [Rhodospirillaceae bacterium]
MLHDTQVTLSKRILAHLGADTTDLSRDVAYNDVTAFTSPERLAREWENLFLGKPQYLGLSCRVPDPGDYLTNDDLGVPILVARGKDGRVRAFLNVCRHRGARVAEGCGKGKRAFVCPYHAWSYDTAGRLVVISEQASFGHVDKAAHGLRELTAAERHGLIFVAPRPDTALNLDPVFEGLDEDFASYNFGNFHHYATRKTHWKMNWKIAIDTFLEPYHFSVLHKNTVGPLLFPNLCIVDTFGQNLREVFPRRAIVDFRNKPESEWNLVEQSAIVYLMFPNVVIVIQIDHYEIWRVYPANGSVDEVTVYLEFYIPEPAGGEMAVEHWRKNMDLVMRTVETEDFPAGEGIQAGLLSGAQNRVIYGRNEPALQFFEKTVMNAVGAASLASE